MNVKELIEEIGALPYTEGPIADTITINRDWILESIEQLDEPETGHADEAPRYVKNILARLRELPLHDREVWLKAIMGEFEQDFSYAKWREGYEQGKFEGEWAGQQLKDADKIRQELNKPVVLQFVADWYEENKDDFETSLFQCVYEIFKKRTDDELNEFEKWVIDENTEPFKTIVNMHQFGYEVEEEKRYLVRIKGVEEDNAFLNYYAPRNEWFMDSGCDMKDIRAFHTRKELEDADFGWVFDCQGVEVEEV
ncbi:DUF1642 domain-containing protein [Streptococcus oralis]|uniref:DUF1642 domain-containing protein n=1 Tax=Streptococcus oralis TaxID=1303 RepID=UPI0022837B44|nr:DUF1642 domain-containing protein [Streptococcus oralis]MCY7080102.1 DUF1642 domain-containing protein [Streptococcus oralis]